MYAIRLILATAVLWLAAAAIAQPAAIPVTVSVVRTDARETLALNLVALRVTDEGRVGQTQQVFPCVAPGHCTVDLPPGMWLVSGVDDSRSFVWPKSLEVGADRINAVTVTASATTVVSGTFVGVEAAEGTMMFRSPEANAPAGGDVVPCPTEAGRWTCRVPRGTWDLRFRIRGYASHYFSDVHLTEAPRDLGTLQMQRGASVVGQVLAAASIGARAQRPEGIIVTLRAAATKGSTVGDVPVQTESTTAKGFFHFTGISPGQYEVEARRGTLRSEARTITVIAEHEAALSDPLMLTEPLTLMATITTDRQAEDTQWFVELFRRTADGHSESLGQRRAVEGVAEFAVHPGSYEVEVKTGGSTWARRTADISTTSSALAVFISRRAVEGRVRLGEKGIPASLEIQDAEVGASVNVQADEEGLFRTELPALADEAYWRVHIDSPLLDVSRTIPDARIRIASDGTARLDLDLPFSRLAGRVVGTDGKPVERGFVNVASSAVGGEVLLQANIGTDGYFVLNGLVAGEYTARALTYDKRSSDPVPVTVRVGEDDESVVTLTVKSEREIKGVVSSDAGPVPAAVVVVMPTDHPTETFEPRATDVSGRFAFLLPNDSTECDFIVDAPGFALRLFHRAVAADSVTIRVDQRGGKLRLRLPQATNDGNVQHPWLIHDGGAVSAYALVRRRGSVPAAMVPEGFLEPGAYRLCLGRVEELRAFRAGISPPGRCVSGLLVPFGDLELDATAIAASGK